HVSFNTQHATRNTQHVSPPNPTLNFQGTPMSQTLDQILGGANLTGVIQQTSTGIPDVFPAAFYASRRPVDGDTAEYTRIDATRQTARIAAYGSPSQQRELKNVAKVPVKLIHTIESVLHKPQ